MGAEVCIRESFRGLRCALGPPGISQRPWWGVAVTEQQLRSDEEPGQRAEDCVRDEATSGLTLPNADIANHSKEASTRLRDFDRPRIPI